MLKIEKIKEKIKNFDTEKCGEDLNCYLSRIAANQNYSADCYRESDLDCSECLRLSLLELLEEYKEEYKEPIKLTQFEYEYLKFAKENGYNFIARDKNNNLYLYSNKPWKGELIWHCIDGNTPVFAKLFKFVTWEDESPMLIEELLKCEVIENE
jgi:hypothetical protein